MLLNARRLPHEDGERILLAIEAVTEWRRAKHGRAKIETPCTEFVKNIKDHSINERFRQWYGLGSGEPMTAIQLISECVHPSDRTAPWAKG